MKHVKQSLQDFVDNEDADQGEKDLRAAIKTIDELRFAVACARQDHPDMFEEILDCLTTL